LAALEYRCVCGDAVSLDSTQGGRCGRCGRRFDAEVLRTASAETISFPDLSSQGTRAAMVPAAESDEQDRRIGTRLGHYQILRRLGEGGMGSVYQALDESLQRYVAVKVIRTAGEAISDTRHLQRLLQEAIAQARVNHPNVVHIYFVGRHEGSPFVAMELVGGPSLAERLEQGPLPFGEVIKLGLQLADALRTCLNFDILHGDIKPGNVLLTDTGAVKLSDFGLATRLSEACGNSRVIAGTPEYLAPEISTGQCPDVRSDLYSLGVTLFEMTFGRLPYSYSGSSVHERMQTHQQARVEFPEPWPNGVPEPWRDLLKKLLAKSPEDRYPGYEELLADLKRLRPVSLPTAGRVPRALAWLIDLTLTAMAQAALAAPMTAFVAVLQRPVRGPLLLLAAATGFAASPLLFSVIQAYWGTTPGKKLLQIRIVDRHGLPPSKTRLAIRAVFQILPLWSVVLSSAAKAVGMDIAGLVLNVLVCVVLTLDAGFALFGRQRRSIHDRAFDTHVVLDAGLQEDAGRP
jgi:eukaryotic-like serine/threonine-protein kinase